MTTPSSAPTNAAVLPAVARALAERHQWVLGRHQLALVGVDRHSIRSHVRARRWRVVGQAVVLHRGPLPLEQRWRVALLQGAPGAALAAWSALEAAGLRGWGRPATHVLIRRGAKVVRVAGVVIHESRRYDPERDAIVTDGLARTSAARAAVDAAAWSDSPRSAAGVLAATVQQRLCTPGALAAELDRAGRIRHARTLREVVADIAGGAQSLAEIDLARLLAEAGLPAPRRQALRRDGSGRRRYLDAEVMLPDGVVLVVEVDGSHHIDVGQWWADQQRQNDVTLSGQLLIRLPAFVVRHERDEVVRQLGQVRDAHRAPGAST